ncbi:MAG TPA: hypothetical protein VNQ76_06210 [Planctomicrobium sp.]|nr:hypothetical protein [Planctomicrobium sp.]
MIQASATFYEPKIIRFPSLLERSGKLENPDEITLPVYYETVLLPDLKDDLSPRSLKEDRIALNHWVRHTNNPPLHFCGDPVNGNDLLNLLMSGMTAAGCRPPTVNKTWRELRSMFSAASEEGLCAHVPVLLKRRKGKRIRSRLIKESPKLQRQIVTEDELKRLWSACRFATYPRRQQFPTPRLWRVALVLFWTYGARTIDFLHNLRWEHVKFSDKLLQFTAQKTSKLQGLPLTEIAIAHLKSIKGHSERVFPGFNTPGCFLQKTQKWKRGFRATWNSEICPNASIDDPITLKHFRERVLTRYNAMHSGLGSWILGHYMPGVSAQNYDLPTDQIRELICSAPVPDCFQMVGI